MLHARHSTGVATGSGDCGGGSATVTFGDVSTPANCTGHTGVDRIWTATCSHLGKLVRYADDFVILCRTRAQAEQALAKVMTNS